MGRRGSVKTHMYVRAQVPAGQAKDAENSLHVAHRKGNKPKIEGTTALLVRDILKYRDTPRVHLE